MQNIYLQTRISSVAGLMAPAVELAFWGLEKDLFVALLQRNSPCRSDFILYFVWNTEFYHVCILFARFASFMILILNVHFLFSSSNL